MKKKSVFSQVILLIIAVVLCVVLTVGIALLAGSISKNILDFGNLNYYNLIPALVVGVFLSLVIIGIVVLFISRSVFLKVKEYFTEENKEEKNK